MFSKTFTEPYNQTVKQFTTRYKPATRYSARSRKQGIAQHCPTMPSCISKCSCEIARSAFGNGGVRFGLKAFPHPVRGGRRRGLARSLFEIPRAPTRYLKRAQREKFKKYYLKGPRFARAPEIPEYSGNRDAPYLHAR